MIRLKHFLIQHKQIGCSALSPVINDSVYLQPLWSDAISVEALVQVVRILLDLLASVRAAVVQRWGLVHVRLAAVVAEHSRVVDIQL